MSASKSQFSYCLILLLYLQPFNIKQTIAETIPSLYESNPPYEEIISRYEELARENKYAKLIKYGETDGGQNLHLFVITKSEIFNPQSLKEQGNVIFLINNGIHPGEPDGINASLLMAERLLANNGNKLPEHVTICILPMFNIEGALERTCCSRVNQNGPDEYGFRANGMNLDLNRDFIKADSQNMLSWLNLFHQWDPDVFIDTHVSDGADYQYNMTLIPSQYDKMYSLQGEYMKTVFTPALFEKMKEKNEEIGYYVETFSWELPPDSGMMAFLETPRYGTGYTTLFNTLGFIAESHMLKPFPLRVKATEKLLNSLVEICEERCTEIISMKKKARDENKSRSLYPINWKLDQRKSTEILFKGYEHGYKTSNVTGLSRLFYDKEKPFQKKLPYFDSYLAGDTILAPEYYLIPQAWRKIIKLMKAHNVSMIQVDTDSSTEAGVYFIDDYKTVDKAYEGHYLHYNTKVRLETEKVLLKKGDFLIPVQQYGNRFIIETMEPISVDSYFNWGFFDAILQQKEWFSAYVFEDLAVEILKEDKTLKNKFEALKRSDSTFSSSSFSQLYYIYKNSKYFEKNYMRYPIYRIGKR